MQNKCTSPLRSAAARNNVMNQMWLQSSRASSWRAKQCLMQQPLHPDRTGLRHQRARAASDLFPVAAQQGPPPLPETRWGQLGVAAGVGADAVRCRGSIYGPCGPAATCPSTTPGLYTLLPGCSPSGASHCVRPMKPPSSPTPSTSTSRVHPTRDSAKPWLMRCCRETSSSRLRWRTGGATCSGRDAAGVPSCGDGTFGWFYEVADCMDSQGLRVHQQGPRAHTSPQAQGCPSQSPLLNTRSSPCAQI